MFQDIMTGQGFAVMASIAAFMVAYTADSYTTTVGLQNGFTETNPLNSWLFNKIGLPLTTFIEAVIVLWLGAFLTDYGWAPATAMFGTLTVTETFFAVRNYLRLKKAKISLK